MSQTAMNRRAMSQEAKDLHARNVQDRESRRVDQASVFRKAFVATLGALAAIAVVQVALLVLFLLAVGFFGVSL
jgi:hypothetical protein